MKKIKIGIVGYGNLGKGLISAIEKTDDMELVKIFTRRDPASFADDRMESMDNILNYKDSIDVLLLALGSATDIPEIAPKLAAHFNIVDSYDNHHNIPNYFKEVDAIAAQNGKTIMISMGWDPGLFSLNRLMGESILPQGKTFTFWGTGVSQGHSDAVRRIAGVKNAVQYTLPKREILENIAYQPDGLTNYETHDRQCFVVLEEGADPAAVTEQIVTMKDYFENYNTEVNFISEEEFLKNHSAMPHGGHVIRVGETGTGRKEKIDFSLELESNPEFTASVVIVGARAVHRIHNIGTYGALTIFDVPPALYSPFSHEELIEKYL